MGNYAHGYAQRNTCECGRNSRYNQNNRTHEKYKCLSENDSIDRRIGGTMIGTIPNGRNMNEWCQIRDKLASLYFVIVELELYLDGHPKNRDALARYKCVVEEYEELAECYEEKYGPLMARNNNSAKEWLWATNPWPWEV